MYEIGVAGNSAGGKSTFCKLFGEKHLKSGIVTCDAIMTKSLYENTSKLIEAFDEEPMWTPEKKLDLRYMFASPDRVSTCIAITKDDVQEGIYDAIKDLKKNKKSIALIDWAWLPTSDVWKTCDKRIIVDADEETRFQRFRMRARGIGYSDDEIKKFLKAVSLPVENIECDMRINNMKSDSLNKAVEAFKL